MRVYIAHSKDFDYKNELYAPIREDSFFKEVEVILPHEKSEKSSNTREFYKSLDIVIAEVSFVATGMGIELGWTFDDKKKIYCIYKKDSKISGSLKSVTKSFYEYSTKEEMLSIIKEIIENNKSV